MNLPNIKDGMYEGYPVVLFTMSKDGWMVITEDNDNPDWPLWEIHLNNEHTSIADDKAMIDMIISLSKLLPRTKDGCYVQEGTPIYLPNNTLETGWHGDAQFARLTNGTYVYVSHCTVFPKETK